MPESMSVERRNLLRALGAELVLTPAEQGMSGAVAAAKRIAEEQDAFVLGRITNPQAVVAHYKTTGPEIFKDSVGKMDVLVAGVGSGSTITGDEQVPQGAHPRLPGWLPLSQPPRRCSRTANRPPILFRVLALTLCQPSLTVRFWTRLSRWTARKP